MANLHISSEQMGTNNHAGKKKAEAPAGPALKRNLLIRSGETGEGRGRYGEKVPAQPEELKTAERAVEFGRFLNDHLGELLKASERDSSFLQNTAFESDRNLVRLLTKDGKVNTEEIKKFLTKEQNWGVVDQIMVKDAMLKAGAIGTSYNIRNQPDEQNVADRLNVHTGIDEGFMHNLTYGIAVPWMRRVRAGAGGHNPFRSGIVLEKTNAIDAFNAISSDPQLKAYVKGMYGIDTDDYRVRRDAVVARRPGERFSQTDVSILKVQKDISAQLMTHMKYYKDFGVDTGNFNVAPFHLFANNNYTPDISGVGLAGEVEDEFRPNEGGLVDRWGQRKDSPYFCREQAPTPIHTVGLDTAQNMTRAQFDLVNLNVRESLRNYITAQERVVNKRVERSIKEVLADHKNDTHTAGELRTKEKSLKADQGVESRLVKDAKTQRAKLEDERKKLNIPKEGSPEIEDFESKAVRVRELEEKLDSEYTSPMSRSDFLSDVEEQIRFITEKIEGGPTVEGLDAKIENLGDEKEEAIRVLGEQNIEALKSPDRTEDNHNEDEWSKHRTDKADAQRRGMESANRKYDHKIKKLEEAKADLERKKTELATLKTQYKNASGELKESEDILIEDAPRNLGAIRDAYKEIAPGATGVSDDELATMSIDEIYAKLTRPLSLFRADVSTPQKRNELKEKIFLAKVDLKAQKIEEYDQSSASQTANYKEILERPVATIKPDDLLSMPEAQLLHLLGQPPYSWGHLVPAVQRDKLRSAQAEARKKLRIRYGVYLEDKAADYDNQIAALDKVITDGMDGKEKAKFVGAAADLVERQEEILSGKTEEELNKVGTGKQDKDEGIAAVAAHPDTFFSNASMANDARFTETERVFGAQRGYLEMMNLLFDYQRKGNREEYFEEIVKVLPPQKLAELLNENLGLGLSRRSSLRTVFTNLQGRTTLGTQDLIPPFLAIVRDVRDRALVI